MTSLQELRAELDAADEALLVAAAERLAITRRIGAFKAATRTGTFDRVAKRWSWTGRESEA